MRAPGTVFRTIVRFKRAFCAYPDTGAQNTEITDQLMDLSVLDDGDEIMLRLQEVPDCCFALRQQIKGLVQIILFCSHHSSNWQNSCQSYRTGYDAQNLRWWFRKSMERVLDRGGEWSISGTLLLICSLIEKAEFSPEKSQRQWTPVRDLNEDTGHAGLDKDALEPFSGRERT